MHILAQNFTISEIQNRIYSLRDKQIMLDSHLAELYGVELKRLNEQVKRNAALFQRLYNLEQKQLKADNKIEMIFKALENNEPEPKNGIFYEGQIFDAYVFVSNLVRSAKQSIRLIDNYIDESVLLLFTKRKKGVEAIIYTKPGKILIQDLGKKWFAFSRIDINAFSLLQRIDALNI
jgi:hypothetical protein